MPIPAELLDLLRCPKSGQRLAIAAPEALEKLEEQRREGCLLLLAEQPQWNPDEPLEAVLIREDCEVGYLVQGGIPILLPDHGIAMNGIRE